MKPPPSCNLSPSLESLFADTPEIILLDNGLTVVFQHNPAHPIVSVQTWIKTGSIHEDAYLGSGLSHFVEHMVFKGTETRGPGEIARDVQAFGGQVNAYTAFDRTVYYIDGPSEALDKSLDLLCDMTLHATLPKGEIEKEKGVILREIDMTLDDPDRILSRALFAAAYREHPFRFPVIGLRPLFEKVDRSVLDSYYKSRYQPNNMVLSVVGDFDRETLIEGVVKTFGQVPRGSCRPVIPSPEPAQLARREIRLSGDYQTARGFLAYKIPSMRDPQAPALDVIAAIVGSGYSGRLRQKLREDLGLVHGISASAWNPGNPGLFIIHFQCSADKAEEAETAIRGTFKDFSKEGFTEQEIEKARRFAFVSEVQSRQTTSGLASRLGLVTALVGDLHYPRRYFEKIQETSCQELLDLAAHTFRDDNLTVATLLPESSVVKNRTKATSGKLPDFQEITLSNGARIFWQQDRRLPRTYLRYGGLGGPMYEDSEYKGATSLLATVMARDTRFKSSFEVAQDLESNGGFLLDASGNNSFALAVEVIPEMATEGLEALRDAVLHPAFKPATVAREREAQLAGLREEQDEILDRGRMAMRRLFFGDHPFATGPEGLIATVDQIDAAYLQILYKRLVVSRNAVLVLSGDFDPDTLLPQATAFMEQIPDLPFHSQKQPFSGPATVGDFSETLTREQSVVFDAFPDVGFKPERDIAVELLDEILSDMSSTLFKSVREDQSLAYFVGASRLLGEKYGTFYLYAGTHPGTVQAVFNCFDTELERIRKGNLTEEEINHARTRLKVHNRFALQSPATRAARAALNGLYGKPIMNWLTYEARLDAVTAEDLTDFANTFLSPEKRLRFTIGPKID